MSDPQFGEVIHDPIFVFQVRLYSRYDLTGNRLLLELDGLGGASRIVARTTSQPDSKSRIYGCHNDDRFANFFVPLEAGLFRHDT